MANIRVLGIDISISNLGLVRAIVDTDTNQVTLVEKIGLISTEVDDNKKVRQNSKDLARAKLLVQGLRVWSDKCAIGIAEMPHGSQSARAMASYGVCIGVMASFSLPLIEVSSNEVKIAATGDKTAEKEEMIAWAVAKFPDAGWLKHKHNGAMVVTQRNEHMADALAAIHAGVLTQQYAQAMAIVRSMAA